MMIEEGDIVELKEETTMAPGYHVIPQGARGIVVRKRRGRSYTIEFPEPHGRATFSFPYIKKVPELETKVSRAIKNYSIFGRLKDKIKEVLR